MEEITVLCFLEKHGDTFRLISPTDVFPIQNDALKVVPTNDNTVQTYAIDPFCSAFLF